jgi:T-complex protein 1 subunit gamma
MEGQFSFAGQHKIDDVYCAVMTNDGHAILREIDVKHPAAKSMIELSRAQVWCEFRANSIPAKFFNAALNSFTTILQDEEVGDGTTSVIILAGMKRSCS